VAGTDRSAVRRLTHRSGANFSLGFRLLPPAKRRAVYAAYAVCRVADDIVDEVPPGEGPDRVRARLDAFAAEVEATYAGRPGLPVTRALAECLERFPIPREAFLDLVEGCRWDLVRKRYATFGELEAYCALVAVTISDISLAVFGSTATDARDLGRSLAMALQLTNVCRDVGEDLGRDRVYLPQDELERFGVGERDLLARRQTRGFDELMAFQTERARAYYRAAVPLPTRLERDARLAVRVMGLVYARILERIATRPGEVLHRRVGLGRVGRARVVVAGLLGRPFVG